MKIRNEKNKRRGSRFRIASSRLIEFSRMPIALRLRWLEEANHFLNSITGKDFKAKRKLFREKTV